MKTTELTQNEESRKILNAYRYLLRDCGAGLSKADRKQIRQAFNFSYEAHKNVRRKSGEPYILHPLAVARIVAKEMNLKDRTAIIAALIHDVVEDTDYSLVFIRKEFGQSVAHIVDGLTKISNVIDPHSSQQAETYRKMLLIMSDDIRTALIKLADRLHNMRTLDHMKPEKQLKIATETLFLYAPLASRLGMFQIKTELEDLSLKYSDPAAYYSIIDKLDRSKQARDRYIQRVIAPLRERLKEHGIDCAITGRVKSVYSIYNKMKKRNIEFKDVYDIYAIRIVLNTPAESEKDGELCWKTYYVVTEKYRTHPERLRDWISNPRPNGYEALHTTVIGPDNRWVEIQIRSKRMDNNAEKGISAHWKYKEGNIKHDEAFEHWLARLRDLIENHSLSGVDFVQEVKANLISEQIYVFSPQGEVKVLPAGATALDFAFEIHTELGYHCIGAKVNHQLAPLKHPLKNGDQVEIITSDKSSPEEEWLDFVKTHKAISKINDALKTERRYYQNRGKEIFDWKLRQLKISEDHVFIQELLDTLHLNSLEELHYRLGAHKMDLQRIQDFIQEKQAFVDKLKDYSKMSAKTRKNGAFDKLIKETRGDQFDQFYVDKDFKNLRHQIAPCCNPIPGDDVIGFIETNGFFIHRTNCSRAIELMAYKGAKMVKVKWSDSKNIEFLAAIKISGADRKGMLIDILKAISEKNDVNIRSLSIDTYEGIYEGVVKLYVQNTSQLERVIADLSKVDRLIGAKRV